MVAQTSPRIGRAFASAERHELGVGRHRADRERPVAGELDPAQLLEPVQVDEHVGRGRARLHDVDQRLPAGERAGAVVRGEQLQSLRDRPRLCVFDLAQQHRSDPIPVGAPVTRGCGCLPLEAARRNDRHAQRGSRRGWRRRSPPARPRRGRARPAPRPLQLRPRPLLRRGAARAAAPGSCASRASRVEGLGRERGADERQVELVVVRQDDDRGRRVGLDVRQRLVRPEQQDLVRARNPLGRGKASAARPPRSSASRAASPPRTAPRQCRRRRRRRDAAEERVTSAKTVRPSCSNT